MAINLVYFHAAFPSKNFSLCIIGQETARRERRRNEPLNVLDLSGIMLCTVPYQVLGHYRTLVDSEMALERDWGTQKTGRGASDVGELSERKL